MEAITTVTPHINSYSPRENGVCSVSIRVSHMRKKKYYPVGIYLTPEEFDKTMNALRRSPKQKTDYDRITAFFDKAEGIVKKLTVFTFDKFEELYFENRDAADTVSFAFNKYIEELKAENRIGTAVSFECAKGSLESYRNGLKLADITPVLLKRYESWMISKGKSLTTVGIYLRSLRAVLNRAKIDRALYPFGDGKDKYSIPTGKNTKKALTAAEIAKIYSYQPEPNSTEEMARDYWVFMFLCNGINVKDFCLLKQGDIKGNVIEYQRAKTERTKRDGKKIKVSIKPEMRTVLNKWGQKSINPETYLFPHLSKGMTVERERVVYQQLTKIINKYMKRIAQKLGIDKNVTTYYSRHSFATILKNSGVSTEFISEALGHSDLKVTNSYLDSFETEQIHLQTDVLTDVLHSKTALK